MIEGKTTKKFTIFNKFLTIVAFFTGLCDERFQKAVAHAARAPQLFGVFGLV